MSMPGPGNPSISTIPVHGNRDMKAGTLRSPMAASGLKDEDL